VTGAAALAALVLLAAGWGSVTGRVHVVLDDKMKARPIEGYVWFVGLDWARPVGVASVTLRGAAGRHLLVSYIRTCDGNCSLLDPPSKRCSRFLRLGAGVVATATVRLRDSGCRILVR
jgi:hypothetical protein